MDNPIDHSRSQLSIGDNLAPLAEWQISGHYQALALVGISHGLEYSLRTIPIELAATHLIEDKQADPPQVFIEGRQPVSLVSFPQLGGKLREREGPFPQALHASLHAKPDRNMVLPLPQTP